MEPFLMVVFGFLGPIWALCIGAFIALLVIRHKEKKLSGGNALE